MCAGHRVALEFVSMPMASKDFYVDALLRGPASLARPVALKTSDQQLKFGVNAILALDSRERISPTRNLYATSE